MLDKVANDLLDRAKGHFWGPFVVSWAAWNYNVVLNVASGAAWTEKMAYIEASAGLLRFGVYPLLTSMAATLLGFAFGDAIRAAHAWITLFTDGKIGKMELAAGASNADWPLKSSIVATFAGIDARKAHSSLESIGHVLNRMNAHLQQMHDIAWVLTEVKDSQNAMNNLNRDTQERVKQAIEKIVPTKKAGVDEIKTVESSVSAAHGAIAKTIEQVDKLQAIDRRTVAKLIASYELQDKDIVMAQIESVTGKKP